MLINRAMANGPRLRGRRHARLARVHPGADREAETINPADGEKVHLKIVGIGVYPNEVVPTAQYDSLQFVYLTPAFFQAHQEQSQEYGFEVIRLRNGKEDVAAVPSRDEPAAAQARRATRRTSWSPIAPSRTPRSNARSNRRRSRSASSRSSPAIVFLLVVGQVLTRQIALDSDEYPTLRAIGHDPAASCSPPRWRGSASSRSSGAVVAVVGAALASPLMPIGPARLAEPHPGFAINVAILGLGFLAHRRALRRGVGVPRVACGRGTPGSTVDRREPLERRRTAR